MDHDHDHNNPPADPRIWNQFAFEVTGATDEADVNDQINAKMARYLDDPADWTVVQKQMQLVQVDASMDGRTIDLIHAQVTCARVAGCVGWDIEYAPDAPRPADPTLFDAARPLPLLNKPSDYDDITDGGGYISPTIPEW